jgi:L-cysteine/cystine lyase
MTDLASPDLARRLPAIREEFPVLSRVAYLNTGTAGPRGQPTAEAMGALAQRQLLDGRSNFHMYLNEYFPMAAELRGRFARVLGAVEDEVGLTHHTTEGMNIAVWGINWRPGDEVITTSGEHDGAWLPVYAAVRRYGLTLRVVDVGSDDAELLTGLTAALSPRTRLVVLSHVLYKTGAVLPLAEIARVTHQAGALLAVDGAQSGGAMPVNVRALGVDLYAIPGQKWLCGPEGMGAVYVRRERISEFLPTFVGGFGLRSFTDCDVSGFFMPAPGARRFEVGTIYWPAVAGMAASLRWIEDDLGLPAVYAQIAAITRRCREILAEVPGCTVHTPAQHAGLTAFSVDGLEPVATAQALAERGVVVRSVHDPDYLRVSTGFYNDESDLIRLRDALIDLHEQSH